MRFEAQIDYLRFNVLIIFKNLSSTNETSRTIIIKIQKNIKMQRIEKIIFIHFFISSPLGLMPKSNEKWQRIHHLSHPKGSSVNDEISLKIKKLKYVKFQKILNFILIVEFDCLIMKKNIKNVFRNISMISHNQWLLRFEWKDFFYKKKILFFDLMTISFLFNFFDERLHWIMKTWLH